MGFLDEYSKEEKVENKNPFAKKAKGQVYKPVKISEEYHYILKSVVALKNDGMTMTDHANKALEKYIKENNFEEFVRPK